MNSLSVFTNKRRTKNAEVKQAFSSCFMRAFFGIGYVNFSIRTDNKRGIVADSILEQLGIKK